MAEIDAPNNKKILAMVIAVIVSLVLVVIGVEQYYDTSVRAEIQRKQNGVVDPLKERTRMEDRQRLSEYRFVDESKGIVRIPVDRAEEQVLADWDKRSSAPVTSQDPRLPDNVPPAAPAPAPASQPASSAAPATAPATSATPASAPTSSKAGK